MAPWVTWVGVAATQFRLTRGSEQLVEHASSVNAKRSFCGACGSQLFFRGKRWADEVHIARPAFDGEIDREIGAHVYFDHRAKWHVIGDAIPRYGGTDGTEPMDPSTA